MTLDEVRSFLAIKDGERQVNRVLHGFPSPRLWTADAVSMSDVGERRRNWQRISTAAFHLYVGVPFCIRTDPDRCGYCLFPVEVFEGSRQLDIYLDYLAKEGEMYRDTIAGAVPESVYIGGGTPNLMKPPQYERMMDIIRSVFPTLSETTPVTLEGIPQLFTRQKLERMRAAGVNRVSMGVQQIDQTLNQLSGRRQTPQHVFDAIAWCREFGLQCNVDLIFGWPQQTVATMLADLRRVVDSGIDHIAHYELNIGGPTDFSLNRRHELPSPELTLEMYRIARDFLVANGYRQLTTYDFQKTDDRTSFVYEECRRDCRRTENWGWGFAGVTDFGGTLEDPGFTTMNHRKVQDYYGALDRGEFPVERGFEREAVDLRLHALFRNLQGMRVDRASYLATFGIDPVAEYESVWTVLEERGWAKVDATAITLLDDGVYYTPMIQALLSASRLEELRKAIIGTLPTGRRIGHQAGSEAGQAAPTAS